MMGQVEITEGRLPLHPAQRGEQAFEVDTRRAHHLVRRSLRRAIGPERRVQAAHRAVRHHAAQRTHEAYKKRVPVEVIMRLRDKLMNPEIGFEVRLPSVDEEYAPR
jgi:hypothetical protein